MNNFGRWLLAVAVVAITGWVGLHTTPGDAPAAISKPSAAVNRLGGDDRISRRPDAGTVEAPTNAQLHSTDWAMQFHAAGANYFAFVMGAAQAAYAGDGAAQYYIGRALTRCEETNVLYRDADNADQAVSHLAFAPALLELERKEYLNCRTFLSESPFKGLPDRAGGYPPDYWRSRAVESRFPVAMVAAALDSPDKYPPRVIAAALATGDVEAMLLFGWSQAAAAKAAGSAPIMAAAWVLAACRSGANCGPTNDALPLATCSAGVELGCTERYTAVDELTASLGAQDLKEANLLAQDIQGSMQFRDPERLMKYLPF